jgi:hypothetical protein
VLPDVAEGGGTPQSGTRVCEHHRSNTQCGQPSELTGPRSVMAYSIDGATDRAIQDIL